MEDSQQLVNAINYIFIIIGLICLYIFFIKKPKKNLENKTCIVSNIIFSLYYEVYEITNKYKEYIYKESKIVKPDHGCLLELKLFLNNDESIHVYCNTTFFLIFRNDKIEKEKHSIKTLDAYIASLCDVHSKSTNLEFSEDLLHHA